MGASWTRYRWISGWTYAKTEKIADSESRADANIHRLPPRLEALYARVFGEASGNAAVTHSIDRLVEHVVDLTLRGRAGLARGPATSAVERFIQETVTSATELTGSDFGMSSSMRDIGRLRQAQESELLTQVLALQPKDFFTCIVARAGLQAALGPRLQKDIYRAVQKRMQFNRWHFIAGNFSRDKLPKARHYYYPPLTPDLAEWSDVQHAGHSRAGVRYCIRAPGPDMGDEPLRIGRHLYRGFYDVRVVRMSGRPFTVRELLIARTHTQWLTRLFRRLALTPVAIDGFVSGDGYEAEPTHMKLSIITAPDSADAPAPAPKRRPSKPIRSVQQLTERGLIESAERTEIDRVAERFSVAITPDVADLIEHSTDPIARQFVPDTRELIDHPEELRDPIADDPFTPVKGITHRYPDRVLFKPVHVCPVYCRFCFRREKVGPGSETLTRPEAQAALDYVRRSEGVWEVIFTGGDPLILSPAKIREYLGALSEIAHVKVVRFHTRVPVVDPERINHALVSALRSCAKTVYIVVHTNHERELAKAAREALARLVDNGIPVLSQTVLLRGVNDNETALENLFRALIVNRVKPYYLHHGDLAKGTGHFRTSVGDGQALMRNLRGRLSGVCQPTYVLDIPGGHGKVPIGPNYLARTENEGYVVEDPSGGRHAYHSCLGVQQPRSEA